VRSSRFEGPVLNSRDNLTTVTSIVRNRYMKVRSSGDTCEGVYTTKTKNEFNSHGNLVSSRFCCSHGRCSLTVQYEGSGVIIQTSHIPLTIVTETLSNSLLKVGDNFNIRCFLGLYINKLKSLVPPTWYIILKRNSKIILNFSKEIPRKTRCPSSVVPDFPNFEKDYKIRVYQTTYTHTPSP